MNSRGQVMILGIMIAMALIILALALAPAVVESSQAARNATVNDTIGLDCSNSSISNFDKAACLSTDSTSFYFIGTLIFVAGAYITARITYG